MARCTSKSNEWCFTVIPGMDSLKPIKFSSVSDRDRREWMQAVKQCLYSANRVPRPQRSPLFDGLLEDYEELEQIVFEPYVSALARPDGASDDEEEDHDSDFSDDVTAASSSNAARPISDGSTASCVSSNSNTSSTNTDGASSSGISSKTSSYIDMVITSNANIPFHAAGCASSSVSSSSSPPKHFRPRRESEPSRPAPPLPCARRVVVSDYVNAPAARKTTKNDDNSDDDEDDDDYIYPKSLMEQCSMLESSKSREELLALLQPRPAGTYFIRKSRKDDRNVVAINVGGGVMREMKMWEKEGRFSLDSLQYFDSTEELLKYYHGIKPVPSIDMFLRRGIHAKGDEEGDEHIYSEAG